MAVQSRSAALREDMIFLFFARPGRQLTRLRGHKQHDRRGEILLAEELDAILLREMMYVGCTMNVQSLWAILFK